MLIQALRKETHDLHMALESHPLMKRMMEGDQLAYVGFLRAFSLLLPYADAAAAKFLTVAERQDFSYQDWIEKLQKDLDILGAKPWDKPFPRPKDKSDSWGYLYVLEGSSLGSAVLAKTFEGRDWPLSYLKRSEDKLRWPRFMKALNAQDLDERTAVAGALLGFQTMMDLFDMQLRT